MSVAEPAGNGTISRTGRSGQRLRRLRGRGAASGASTEQGRSDRLVMRQLPGQRR